VQVIERNASRIIRRHLIDRHNHRGAQRAHSCSNHPVAQTGRQRDHNQTYCLDD
jgi:hypothetical protein